MLDHIDQPNAYLTFVRCMECGAAPSPRSQEKQAIADWNRRHAPEFLRKAAKEYKMVRARHYEYAAGELEREVAHD